MLQHQVIVVTGSSQGIGQGITLNGGVTVAGGSGAGVVDRVRIVEGEVILQLADGTQVPCDKLIEIAAVDGGGVPDGGTD